MLLDNVANYPKAPMEREGLGAAFGDGILVSEGEKWKSHRRHRVFHSKVWSPYAPAMTECSQEAAQGWDRKARRRWCNIADEMTHLALAIISRTMFSTDAERRSTARCGGARTF